MNVRAETARSDFAVALREHRLLLLACLTMASIVAVYWQSFSRMAGMWTLSNYQYAWLVYPIAVYVLWRKRHALASVPVRASWAGVAITACLVVAWVLARTVGVQVIEFACASLLIPSVFWAVAGAHALRVAIFPLVLLLAGVPTGEFLVFYLQESTAGIAGALLHLAGVPALREGMFLTLPGGSFEVAEACGGLRYLLAAVMASLAYAYLTYSGKAKRALFILVAAAAMVVANGIRAFIVMVVASATDMQVFAGKDHVYFGMVLFAAVFAGLIYVGDRYADRAPPLSSRPILAVPATRGSLLPATIAVLLFLAAGPALLYLQAQQALPAPVTADLPGFAGCQGPVAWSRDWSPEFQGADHVQRASYECGDHSAGVYFASYASQEQGSELISSGNRVWPHEWRRYVDETTVSVEFDLLSHEVQQVHLRAPGRSMLIWYWYQAGDSVLANEFGVKAVTAFQALRLQPTEASIAVVVVEGQGEADEKSLREIIEPKAAVLRSWYRDNTDDNR